MKKHQITIFTTLLITLFALESMAQSKFKVGITMGSVSPIKEFSSIDNSNLDAGYSESGFTLSFDGDYYLNHRFALSGRLLFGLSSIDEPKAMDWLNQQVAEYLLENEESNRYDIGYWQWSAPLLGLKYNYPIIVNKFYFETGIFTGINISPIPTQELIIFDEENNRKIISKNSKETNISMPFMIDAGFRFPMKDNIQIKVTSSYYQTRINYEHASYTADISTSESIETINTSSIKVPLKALHFSIGVVYSL